MRIKDIKKTGSYIGRILKNPFSRQSRAALKRYVKEGVSLVREKRRGLDFTMVYQCEGNAHNNNYSKSPRSVLKKVFEDIDFSEKHGFLDMGCGKGYVMTEACAYPFERIGGVEYTGELCRIAEKNFRILKLQKPRVFHCDAKQWDGYKEYDIFYFCNPFDETILSVVAEKILAAHPDKTCRIYYLNPHQEERQRAILDAGFRLKKVIKDKNERYFDINVYES